MEVVIVIAAVGLVAAFVVWLLGGRARLPARQGDLLVRAPSERPAEDAAVTIVHSGLEADRALVLGPSSALSAIDSALEALPGRDRPQPLLPQFARRIGVNAGALPNLKLAHESLTGRWVKVSPESAKQLASSQAVVDKAGDVLAVLKGEQGKFKHVVRIQDTAGTTMAASNLAVLVATAAIQQQLNEIQESLEEITEAVDELQATSDIDRSAETIGLQETLVQIYADMQATGRITPEHWDELSNLRQPVNKLVAEARMHVRRLAPATRAGLNREQRVDKLDEILGKDRLEFWLDQMLQSHLAATRFDALYLAYRAETKPEALADLRDGAQQRLGDRRRDLLELGKTLERLTDLDAVSLWDRARWRKKDRLERYARDAEELSERFGDFLALARSVPDPDRLSLSA